MQEMTLSSPRFETAFLQGAPESWNPRLIEVLQSVDDAQAGPDQILNEHLSQSTPIIPEIAALLNDCIGMGRILSDWRKCLLSLIFKGEGEHANLSNRRGIAKRSTLCSANCVFLSPGRV